jgi:hypothetical protein
MSRLLIKKGNVLSQVQTQDLSDLTRLVTKHMLNCSANWPYLFSAIPTTRTIWIMNEGDAPPDAKVWGDKRPSYTNLEDLLDVFDPFSGSKKKGKKAKRGKREQPGFRMGNPWVWGIFEQIIL